MYILQNTRSPDQASAFLQRNFWPSPNQYSVRKSGPPAFRHLNTAAGGGHRGRDIGKESEPPTGRKTGNEIFELKIADR